MREIAIITPSAINEKIVCFTAAEAHHAGAFLEGSICVAVEKTMTAPTVRSAAARLRIAAPAEIMDDSEGASGAKGSGVRSSMTMSAMIRHTEIGVAGYPHGQSRTLDRATLTAARSTSAMSPGDP